MYNDDDDDGECISFHFFALICAYISPQPTQSLASPTRNIQLRVYRKCASQVRIDICLHFLKQLHFAPAPAHGLSCTSQKPQRTTNFVLGEKFIAQKIRQSWLARDVHSSVSGNEFLFLSRSVHRECTNQVGLSCCCCCTVFVRQIACLSVVLCAALFLFRAHFSNPRSK